MALAAPAPHHMPTGRSAGGVAWDETIVPTLRKRLEAESRALTKRMSVQSIAHQDFNLAALTREVESSLRVNTHGGTSTPSLSPRNASPDYPRPSAIPRPSFQKDPEFRRLARQGSDEEARARSNTPNSGSRSTKAPSPPNMAGVPPQKRNRTLSTPYPFERPDATTPPLTTNSQISSARPSRIPMAARNRSGSKIARAVTPNEHPPMPFMNGNGGSGFGKTFPPSPNSMEYEFPAQSYENGQRTGGERPIQDEDPPFSIHRLSRASSFEEERVAEYEHWYRGEGRDGGGRNGGRGEIRLGTTEMLEIAVGGHRDATLEKNRRAAWKTVAPYLAGMQSVGVVGRAQTDDALGYMDDMGLRMGLGERWLQDRVMDENPLTDFEGSATDAQSQSTFRMPNSRPPYIDSPGRVPSPSVSPPPVLGPSPSPPQSPTLSLAPSLPIGPPPRASSPTPLPSSRIQTPPPRNSSISTIHRPPGSRSPNKQQPTNRAISSPKKSAPSSPNSTARLRTRSTPRKLSNARATSPATPSMPSSRIMNSSFDSTTRTPTVTSARDTPLVDAIPIINSPESQSNRNWDEVVLPTVARKLQLEAQDDSLVEIDMLGTPKGKVAKPKAEEEIPPAPGTFGFNANRFRPIWPDSEVGSNDFGTKDADERPPSPPSPPSPQLPQSPPSPPPPPTPPPQPPTPPPPAVPPPTKARAKRSLRRGISDPDMRPIRPLVDGRNSPVPFSSYLAVHEMSVFGTPSQEQRQLSQEEEYERSQGQPPLTVDTRQSLKNTPAIMVTSPSVAEGYPETLSVERHHLPAEESGGCCKCTIM
ncbi:hypothetical protein BOTBODRAFT_35354 [Botryobasidium botryosum FD-172 SS1]|uniref:Uncharacterized protein n=1 Tax=Botryobasidium botryosum (strain FD-172 SS1) TaxID=930990 RepID=A0A067M9U8_BOTB1|nr:hypothetical protein BOTBODRAFT_35354 [Botryobasidium botryosum FD-172 SS1]